MATIRTESDTKHTATVRLNVGGTIFQTTWATLKGVKGSRLCDLDTTSAEWRPEQDEYFFDRDPAVFTYILAFWRTGELHLPGYLCASAIQRELQYWGVSETLVWDCCWKHLYKEGQLQRMKRELREVFADHCPSYYEALRARFRGRRMEAVRWTLWTTLEKPDYSSASRMWFTLYISLVVLSTASLFLQTLPSLRTPIPRQLLMDSGIYDNGTGDCFFPLVSRRMRLSSPKLILLMTTRPQAWLMYVAVVCLVVFTADFVLRLAVTRDRREFCRQWLNWVDVLVMLAEWLGFISTFNCTDHTALGRIGELCRLLSYFRFFRFYRLFWKSDELRLLKLCLKNCQRELVMLIFLAVAASAGFAILVYVMEIGEPLSFQDLPLAMWWAIITLTSVGYGDVTPSSYQGRFVSGMCAISGMLLVALPVAVIATNFGEYHALYREMLALMQRQTADLNRLGTKQERKFKLGGIFVKNKVASLKKW
ncbi:potassium voltage-gated channel protein egl-36-like [Littorina saxatilis]|uniref:BTB domain-containing protein n=1 Tax=Littorina saxatilis TaxID=31220 RepID=A0AAN9AHM6_9CAEN